jgi:hypothetical protein
MLAASAISNHKPASRTFSCKNYLAAQSSALSISNVIHSKKNGQVIEDFHGNADNPFVFATFLFFSRWDFSPRKIPFCKNHEVKIHFFVCFFPVYPRFSGSK